MLEILRGARAPERAAPEQARVRAGQAAGRAGAPRPPASRPIVQASDRTRSWRRTSSSPRPQPPARRLAAPAPAPARARGRGPHPRIELSGPLTEEDREFIDEHLAEGRVFRKYGLVDKAADQFEAVISRFPDNVEARLELRDVYKEKAQTDKAVEQLLALAEIHRLKGDEAAATQAEAEAEALAPKAARAAHPSEDARPEAVAARRGAAPSRCSSPKRSPPDEEIPLEVEESGLDGPALEGTAEAGESLPQIDLGEGGDDELSGQFLDEEPETPAVEVRTESAAPSAGARDNQRLQPSRTSRSLRRGRFTLVGRAGA